MAILAIPSMLLSLMLACSILAQTDKVDEYIKSEMRRQKIPGLSLAVVKNGEVIKTKGYGLASVELNVPATAETIYQSGSIGKQFTATAIMILAEEGKIDLKDKIGKYFDNTPQSWKEITIRHLLTHSSGIKDYTPKDFNYRLDYTDEEMVKTAFSFSADFAPGEKFSYSNTNYALLGFIIEKVSGKFHGDFLKERVFSLLKMDATRVISEADIIPNRAAGYRLANGELKNQEYVSPSLNRTADGSLYFSVLDLVKWDACLYTERILKKSSLDLMWTPASNNEGKTYPYGFGWGLSSIRGRRIVEHSGGWQGFSTHIARYLDDRLTVIVLTNQIDANPTGIAYAVAGLYDDELRPIERKAIKINPAILDAYTGQYELTGNLILTITREGDKLMGQQTGDRKLELLPESEMTFFTNEVDLQITFVKDEKGKVTRLTLHQGGAEYGEAKKIK
ncbi:MAG: serine hydrolase [Blastocatellia bacterium]